MATGAAPTTQSGPPVTSASSAASRHFIDEQLARTRQHIRWMDVASGIVGWLTSLAGFLLVAALFDHWIAPLSTTGRWLALLAMIGMTTVAFWRWILPPLVRRVNPAYAARVIEQRGERLHNSLINYLFLRGNQAGVPDAVYQSMERRAAVDLEHVPWEQVMDHSRTFRWSYVLAGVLAIFAAYKILSPKDPLQTVARVFSPWADLARPSRVELRDIRPGDTKTFHGRPLTVSADVRGLRSGDTPRVVFSTRDGQTVNESVALSASTDGLRFEAIVPPGRDGVRQDLTYRLEAGDAVSRDFHVEVLPAPTIVVERVEYDPPRYTGVAPSVIEHQGDIRGLEGTKVTIRARASLPIKSALIEFDPLHNTDQNAPPDASRILHLTVDGTQARQSFVLQLKADRSGALHGSYQVRFVTQDDVRSEAPIVHSLEVQADLAPEIEFLAPRSADVTLRTDQTLPIEIRAIDPDFGVARLTLRGERDGATVLDERLIDDPKGVPGQVLAKYQFSPKKLQLQAGDEVSLSAEVADNRVDWKQGRPAPNTQRTSIVKVRIVAGDEAAASKDSANPEQSKPKDPATQDTSDPPMPPQKQPPESNPPGEKPNTKPNQNPKPDSKQKSQDKSSAKNPSGSGEKEPQDQPQPGDKPSDKPSDKPGEKPSDKPGDKPGDMPSDKPGDKPGQEPGEKPGDSPGEKPGEKPSEKPGEKPSKQSPNESASGESKPPKPGKQQSGKPQQSGGAADGKGDQQDGGKGQGGSSGSQAPKPNDPPNGAASSESGTPSGNSSPSTNSNNSNSTENSSPSNDPGQATGKPGSKTEGSPSGEGSGTGQPTGELHDGDVFQRSLEHMKARQGGAGKPAGKPSDQPASKPDPTSQAKPNGDTSTGDPPQGTGDPAEGNRTPGQPVPGKPSPGQPGAKPSSAGTGKDNSGQPQGGTETKPEMPPRGGERAPGASPGAGTGQNGESGAGERPEKPNGGSPGPITNPMDRPKSQSPDNKQGAGGDETPTPSESKKQSDSKGGAGGDRAGGGKQGGGQGAKQSGNDSAGSNSPGDEGNGAAQESGKGPDGTKGGQGKPTDKPTGTSSGDQRGAGSATAPSSPNQPNNSAPSTPGGSSPRVPSTGGGKAGGAAGDSPTQAGEVPEGDEANLDYARKSTDLVLEYLKDQQENPDAELLNKLGWTPEDLRKFLDRWQALKQAADRQEPQARHELDESLKSLGLRTGRAQPRTAATGADTVRGNRDDGQRSSPPARYLEQFKAYRKGTSRTEVQGK